MYEYWMRSSVCPLAARLHQVAWIGLCYVTWAGGFSKTRPYRQVSGSVLFVKAGSRTEEVRPMQQAKFCTAVGSPVAVQFGGLQGPSFALSRFGAGRATFSFSALVETKGLVSDPF